MPPLSPAGGLSLLIHILINVISITYQKIRHTFKISEKNFLSNSFDKLINKDGDTGARHLLAYFTILFIFLTMISNLFFVTTMVYELNHARFFTKNGLALDSSNNKVETSTGYYVYHVPLMITSTTTNNILPHGPIALPSYINASYFKEKIDIEMVIGLPSDSLVDFMKSLGILNVSFDARAKLAKEVGAIDELNEYRSSGVQNKDVINRVKDELQKYYEANYSGIN